MGQRETGALLRVIGQNPSLINCLMGGGKMAGAAQDNIVKNFYIGNTHVMISDLYCRDRTGAEVEAVLKHISRQALEAINAAEAREEPQETFE